MILPRLITTLPAAGILTGLLFFGMTRLIDVQWQAAKVSEPPAMDIAPYIVEPKIIITTTRPEEYERVETPPPPPIIDVPDNGEITEPVPTAPEEVELPPINGDVDITAGPIAISYADLQPIVLTPPIMPSRFLSGNHSGHCTVTFDVTPEGHTTNINTTFCTHSILERASRKSVEGWKFRPQVENGQPITARGVKNIVKFEVLDAQGNVLPEPV